MRVKCIWTVVVLAITLATGCAHVRNGLPTADSRDQDDSTTSMADPPIDAQVTTGQPPPDSGEQDQSTLASDPPIDSQRAVGEHALDTGEQGQATLTADQQIDSQTTSGQQSLETGEQGQATLTADQQIDSQTASGQQSLETGEQGQATLTADQQIDSQTASGQQSPDSGEQGQPTPTANPQIASQMTGNPMRMSEAAPSELEAKRNYLIAGINLGESAEIIPASAPNPFEAYSVTRLYGVLDLRKKVRRFETSISYKGGAYFFRDSGTPWTIKSVQQLTVSETISWPRTKLNLQDSPNYFPGGSFGSSAFGGAGSYTLGLGGSSGANDFFGFNNFSGINGVEHFSNVALAQLTHQLTGRSSITFAGADAITTYFGGGSIDSQQISGLAGYSYTVTPRTGISAFYGYQYFSFPGSGTTDANTVQVNYEHSLSVRTTISLGAGPQFITAHTPEVVTLGPVQIPVVVTSHQTGFSADASLGYGLRNGALGLNYEHLLTSGSGVFAGANSDIFSASVTRGIWRAWSTNFSGGFVRLSNEVGNQVSGLLGNSYEYWFAGFAVQHSLARRLNFVASYQFSHNTVTSACSASSGCGSDVHLALISINWRSFPIRLDRGNSRHREIENPPENMQSPQATQPSTIAGSQ